MLKIHLISDLHSEFADYPYKAPEGTDVVVAAGDIYKGENTPQKLREMFGKDLPILFIPGNHEYYKSSFIETNEQFKIKCIENKIAFIHNGMTTIDDVAFFGGTFWSDYMLYGEEYKQISKLIAKDSINDFRLIDYRKQPWERFTVEKTELEHRATKKFIEEMLQYTTEKQLKTVIVTHMAPHPKSIHSKWGKDYLNAYYVSDQTELIEKYKPNLWLHGHTHDSFDYTVDKTRIVCNPRGYSSQKNPFDQENPNFNKNLLIEI